MTTRTWGIAILSLMLGFSPTLKSDTNPSTDDTAAHASLQDTSKSETPVQAPSPKSPSCIDSCLAEGLDEEECHYECTWVVQRDSTGHFSVCAR